MLQHSLQLIIRVW